MGTLAYLNYAGLMTKVRALYGKTMHPADFEHLRSLRTLDEVTDYLREHPAWREAMRTLPAGYVGRIELETALQEELRSEHRALAHFIRNNDRAFWAYPTYLDDLRRILAALAQVSTMDELRSHAEGTIYEKTLKRLRISGVPDVVALESLLRSRYYTYLFQLAAKHQHGAAADALKQLIGETADQMNLLSLMRLKYYFPHQSLQLASSIPVHHRLSRKLFAQLSAAQTYEQLRELLRTSNSFAPYASLSPLEADEQMRRALRKLLLRIMRAPEPSIAMAYAYLSYKELMLNELYSVIESTKYKEMQEGGSASWLSE